MTLWTIADPWWAATDEQVWWSITNPDGSTRLPYDRLLQASEAGELPRSSSLSVAPSGVGGETSTEVGPESAAPPSSASAPSGGERLRVAGTDGAGLSLRDAPSTTAERIGTVAEGAVVESVGGPLQGEGRTWRHVRDSEGREGWVAADFLVPA